MSVDLEIGSLVLVFLTLAGLWARMEHRFTVLEERSKAVKDRLADHQARIERLERA